MQTVPRGRPWKHELPILTNCESPSKSTRHKHGHSAKAAVPTNFTLGGIKTPFNAQPRKPAIVEPGIAINEVEVSQETFRTTGNTAAYIVPVRLITKFGEERVPDVKNAINNLMELIKQERAQ
jgi:hypothetical protein